MNGRSLTMQTAAALTGLMLSAMVADAAEVKVFTSVALTNALDELAPIFEQKTGNKLTISYDLAAVQKKRILDGERADVIILTRGMMDDLAEQMKSKTTLVPGAQSPDLVAKGEVELGIAQASEIVPNAGAQLVGPLPGELGSMTQFSGGIGAESASANASKALIDFLAGQEAGSQF